MTKVFSVSLLLITFAAQVSANTGTYPALVGTYHVSYRFSLSEYQVEDLVNQSDKRTISYGILYPTSTKLGNKLRLSDLNPHQDGINPIELKFKAGLEVVDQYYQAFFKRIGQDQDNSSYDLAQALASMQNFYSNYQLNSTKNGDIMIRDKKFPVLAFSPGAGGQRDVYLGLLEQIASLGVIVIALDQHQWEAMNQIVFDEDRLRYRKYFNRPDFDHLPYHAHLHMRALDIQEVLRHIRNQKNDVFEQANLDKLFVSGHSYGGHAAFYSMRLGLNAAGFINYDGSFSPLGENDHYDPNNEKLNAHILCVSADTLIGEIGEDGPDACKKLFDEFKNLNIEDELASFKFSKITGWGNVDHSDFGIFALPLEIFPNLLRYNYRHTRPSTKDIWHQIAKWTYEIVK